MRPADPYVIKDSGERTEFESGMVRDTADDKINWALVADGPMLRRWAIHLTKGAKKYAKRNWMKATGEAELERFRESAFRHFMQWYSGDVDEDHASATIFNINGAEEVRLKMSMAAWDGAGSLAANTFNEAVPKTYRFPAGPQPENQKIPDPPRCLSNYTGLQCTLTDPHEGDHEHDNLRWRRGSLTL